MLHTGRRIHKRVFVRFALGAVGILLFAWGLAPVYTSRFHTGCVVLLLAGLACLAAGIFYPVLARWVRRLWKHRAGRIGLSFLCAGGSALALLFLVVSGFMAAAACAPPPPDATVIVLGAALRGEKPSPMLEGRLETAAAYLKAHPEASCVVSGGQNEEESLSEAEAMKRYLVEHGIEGSRIFLEDRSTNTRENLQMSREVIERQGLSEAVVIATQEFHQLRAKLYAQEAGFETIGALTAHTPGHLIGSYWIRDFAGICRILVFGY